MKDRIISFLNAEKLSPARFADIIGVQPANISHIISERNKPSLDFIQKMLKSFPDINVEWLITGKGQMYKEMKEQSLFENDYDKPFSSAANSQNDENNTENNAVINNENENFIQKNDNFPKSKIQNNNREVERIIICYSDKTFEFYSPR
ncbi:MAG: helix-turn-helix domain-containing protein [Prevotellaceae bacterium]|jgi:plasmid maintenance system antidote protein VapI|nr:helix-turn-helix domain-containing protein [Prevotellaceae bacterium]